MAENTKDPGGIGVLRPFPGPRKTKDQKFKRGVPNPRRGVEGSDGPGRVSKAMGFSKDMYGKELVPENGLWLEDDGFVPERAVSGPRIGIPYASEEDRNAPLNFRSV